MKRPAAIIDITPRCSKRSRNSALCWLAHGHANMPSSSASRMNGAANCSTGLTRSRSEMPAENHTTISESLYQRVSTIRVEMNRVAESRMDR
ncbi:hypothetical protein D9M68_940890 [compost metagenome]